MNKLITTKFILRAAQFMMIPLLLSILMNMVVSFGYWASYEPFEENVKHLNHAFALGCGLLAWFSIVPIIGAIFIMMRYTDKIDKLEEAKESYEEAEREMEAVRDQYTELLTQNVKQ